MAAEGVFLPSGLEGAHVMAGHGWPNLAILRWLESLLGERFGLEVVLTRQGGRLHLSLPGRPGCIVFAVNDSDLAGSIPVASWPAKEEGWQPVWLDELKAPGVSSLRSPLIVQTPEGMDVDYDVLGFVYWMLARCEEVTSGVMDEHGRFPARASHAFQQGYHDRPIVDEWLALLGQMICRQWDVTVSQRPFTVLVSHDVDEPSRYAFRSFKGLIRAMGGDLLRRKNPLAALRAPWLKLASRRRISTLDPSNTFDWLMAESERRGMVSAFYFICGRTDPGKDADYEIEHPAMRSLLREIHGRGHEIGLHPSYGTFLSPDALELEAARLRQVCAEEGVLQAQWGGRMHFLRWRHPITLNAWEQAGMAYDSTLGYAELPGFRCGTCHEYQAFDPVALRPLNLRIRPLIVMDVTLLSSSYLGLAEEEAYQLSMGLRDACKAVGGNFTLLWHNSNLQSVEERRLYSRILG
ncbi:polysaccharide deacetylase family protein [Pseudomonas entomophila]|uniref:polysaccharide deacetylase family protein n=1 Tax=Pseudomonas entomophila TaxID=312306 RepID=UPI001EFFFBFB|nr:polysaccharide deacetylase family protein [Pseudomonas entomophila]MCG8295047.1 polysaccharide deacetylase family protein [Pseudomonas entomophila]